MNVTRQAVSKWESGESKPSTQNLLALAHIFNVTGYSNSIGVVEIEIKGYTFQEMSSHMRQDSWSSLTGIGTDASSVIAAAFPGKPIILDTHGAPHFHAQNPDKSHATVLRNGWTVHSFYDGFLVA